MKTHLFPPKFQTNEKRAKRVIILRPNITFIMDKADMVQYGLFLGARGL